MISNITIENIKGFGTSNNSFNLSIYPKKVNILVAPNGFGKSSITTAFASLKTNRLDVSIEDLHQNDESLIPKLRLTIDGQEYTASPLINELSSIANCHVIRNRINAKATSKNMGKFHSVSSSLVIDEIEVVKTIPAKQLFPYSMSEIKKDFGVNSKVLNNFSDYFVNPIFVVGLERILDAIQLVLRKRNWYFIENVCRIIRSLRGTVHDIKAQMSQTDFSFLNNSYFQPITDFIKSFIPCITEVDIALFIYQLSICVKRNKSAVGKSIKYYKYVRFKYELNQDINLLGTTWKNIRAEERDKSLKVFFPPASSISYGQRDLLTLIIQLKTLELHICANKKNVLIIDEVFDYLDAVNMTAIQNYLSKCIDKWKSICELYTIVMTHLSPEYFKNYVFSKKLLNVQYLLEGRAQPSKRWRSFLLKREDELIKKDVSKHLLHYDPTFISGHRNDFKKLSLPETWGDGSAFHQELIDQINLYLTDSNDYEPYAICTAVRIRIEKIVYDKLDDEKRKRFLEIHGTKQKLNFSEDFIEVPDLFYLLGIIYNDAEHVKDETSDKPIIYRLDQTIIKTMIKNLFATDRAVIMNDIH